MTTTNQFDFLNITISNDVSATTPKALDRCLADLEAAVQQTPLQLHVQRQDDAATFSLSKPSAWLRRDDTAWDGDLQVQEEGTLIQCKIKVDLFGGLRLLLAGGLVVAMLLMVQVIPSTGAVLAIAAVYLLLAGAVIWRRLHAERADVNTIFYALVTDVEN